MFMEEIPCTLGSVAYGRVDRFYSVGLIGLDPKRLDNKKPPQGIVPSDINEPSKCFHFILYQPCCTKIYNS